MLKITSRPWLAIGILPLALILTGCVGLPNLPGPGTDSDQTEDEIVEDIVEGSNDDVDFESGALPADFPTDIPLVSGEVGPSMSISDGQAWTVTIFADDEATANSAGDLLGEAGFSHDSGFAWENEKYLIVVVANDEADDGRWYVYYQVQSQ